MIKNHQYKLLQNVIIIDSILATLKILNRVFNISKYIFKGSLQ